MMWQIFFFLSLYDIMETAHNNDLKFFPICLNAESFYTNKTCQMFQLLYQINQQNMFSEFLM